MVYEQKKPVSKEQARKQMIIAGCYDVFREFRKGYVKGGMDSEASYWQSYRDAMEGKVPSKPVKGDSQSKVRTIVHTSAPSDVELGEMAERMVSRKVFKKRTATPIENLQWVASHLCVKDVKPRDAPSSTAWGMLMWARTSPTTENIFWSNLFTKSMPTKQQLDHEVSRGDASGVINLIDEVSRISRESKRGEEGQREVDGG